MEGVLPMDVIARGNIGGGAQASAPSSVSVVAQIITVAIPSPLDRLRPMTT